MFYSCIRHVNSIALVPQTACLKEAKPLKSTVYNINTDLFQPEILIFIMQEEQLSLPGVLHHYLDLQVSLLRVSKSILLSSIMLRAQ